MTKNKSQEKKNAPAKKVIRKEVKTKDHKDFKQIQITEHINGKKNIISEYIPIGNINFDASKTVKNFYDKLKSEFSDNLFYVKVLTPSGWYTAANSIQGNMWKEGENYFSDKVKDETKFTESVSKIISVIKNVK